MSQPFTYPQTVAYKPLYSVAKTRRLDDGRFEAVAAFYFGGVRQNMATAFGATRAQAKRAANLAIGCA